MSCYCALVPKTLSYTDAHFNELKATLVENGRGDNLIKMKCQVCGKQWVYSWIPFMHADVDVLAEEGFDYCSYWDKRVRGMQ